MKLALLIPGFQSHAADWCIPAFTNLARELSKHVELHVFTLRYPARRDRYRIGQVRVHAIGGGGLGQRRVPVVSLLKLWRDTWLAVRREHRRSPFTAVLGIWATESGWLATQVARGLGLPSLVHLAGGELTWLPSIRYGNQAKGLARLLVAGSLRNADILTVPSGPLDISLRRSRLAEERKVRRWALGVDTAMFTPCNGPDHKEDEVFTFVTAGSLIPVKGHRWLIEAAARLRQDMPSTRFQLRFLGTGPLLEELQVLTGRLGLEGYVDFAGEVEHHDLPQHYRAADSFLLSSWHEAQCMAALESMACGLPWIAPPVGALADCAQVGRGEDPSGILVGERSVPALASTMKTMIEAGPEARRAWGRAARIRVERDYDLQTQAARLLTLLEELTPAGMAATISRNQREHVR